MLHKLLLPALLGFSLNGFAQKPTLTDDLNVDKDKIREHVFPTYKGKLLYANFDVSPEQFVAGTEKVRSGIYKAISNGSPAEQQLKRKDAFVYSRNLIYWYKMMYGIDSAAASNVEKIMIEKKGAPDFEAALTAAFAKMRPKNLSQAQRQRLDSVMFAETTPNDEGLFKRSESYRSWVGMYLDWKRRMVHQDDTTFNSVNGAMPLSVVTSEIQNPFIKEYICYIRSSANLKVLKKAAQVEKAYRDFDAAVKNPYYRTELKKIYDNYKFLNMPGMSAPDFSYASIDGTKVNLSDLRGKYVYIDVWATWCGPCKAEIPSLQKVEHDYAGKNIHFVSLSVDRMADKAKWESYVRDNKLGGIQVMADKDFSSAFIQKFNIASIPRFMLIDPQGKVVSGDALRPSDPALRAQLDKLLN